MKQKLYMGVITMDECGRYNLEIKEKLVNIKNNVLKSTTPCLFEGISGKEFNDNLLDKEHHIFSKTTLYYSLNRECVKTWLLKKQISIIDKIIYQFLNLNDMFICNY